MHFVSHLFLFMVAASAVSAAVSRLEERQYPCPYDDEDGATIELHGANNDMEWTLDIVYWDSGEFGCIYDVEEAHGSTNVPYPAVAKTPRRGAVDIFGQNEIAALRGIGELYVEGLDEDGYEWIVMKKHPGTVITQTSEWQERFPEGCNEDYSDEGIESCVNFMKYVYQLLARQAVEYASLSGWDHNSQNFAKFLFNDYVTRVNFIDWRDAESISPTNHYLMTLENWYKNFGVTSNLPIEDQDDLQGVCDSDKRRIEGEDWDDPLTR